MSAEAVLEKAVNQSLGTYIGNTAGVARVEEEKRMQRIQRMGQGAMGLGMMRRRQVTTRWANDPVWLNNGSRRQIGQGRVRAPPPQR